MKIFLCSTSNMRDAAECFQMSDLENEKLVTEFKVVFLFHLLSRLSLTRKIIFIRGAAVVQ